MAVPVNTGKWTILSLLKINNGLYKTKLMDVRRLCIWKAQRANNFLYLAQKNGPADIEALNHLWLNSFSSPRTTTVLWHFLLYKLLMYSLP